MSHPVYVVVVYDVSKNSRRARLARQLDGVLRRVQKSVFEGTIPRETLAMLETVILRTIDPTVDTVRIYHICASCRHKTDLLGVSPMVPQEPEDQVIT